MSPVGCDSESVHMLPLFRASIAIQQRFQRIASIPIIFQCLCQIGKGAFGCVWKVQKYFDEQIYAVKQVRLEWV